MNPQRKTILNQREKKTQDRKIIEKKLTVAMHECATKNEYN